MVKVTHQRCLEQGDAADLKKLAASGMDLCGLTALRHSTERKMEDTSPPSSQWAYAL